jgi:hypothetical protein
LLADGGVELGKLGLDPGTDLLAELEHGRIGDPVEGAGFLLATGDISVGVQTARCLDTF